MGRAEPGGGGGGWIAGRGATSGPQFWVQGLPAMTNRQCLPPSQLSGEGFTAIATAVFLLLCGGAGGPDPRTASFV